MRKGTLDPVGWDVGFERLYGNHERIGGLLTISAREARGRLVSGQLEVEAVRRGRSWVVGDPLPLTRPTPRSRGTTCAWTCGRTAS